MKKVTLSGKRCPACGVTVKCYSCYAYSFRFDYNFADFVFSLLFFSASVLRLGVSVVILGLG